MEFSDRERLPSTGPLLIVANHANSLVDPVVLGITARRPVHFLAKAPLFDVPVFGTVLHALGMIPAYRASDDSSQMHKNVQSLANAARLLVEGEAVGIFPEGKSHDLFHVEQVRTGAARIALQAVEMGGVSIKVVPVGINYERKDQFGSAIWVRVGEAIDVNRWFERQPDKEPKQAVRALTLELEARLQELAVHLHESSWEPFVAELQILRSPPGTMARDPFWRVRHRKRVADAMNYFLAQDRARAEAMASKIEQHRGRILAVGLTMDSPILRPCRWNLETLRELLLLAIGLPIAAAGAAHHLVPFFGARLLAAQVQAPGRSTVALSRLLIGLPIYVIWYGAVWWWISRQFTPWTATAWTIIMPFAGLVALSYWPHARQAAEIGWQQMRWLARRSELRTLRVEREQLSKELSTMAAEYEHVCPLEEDVQRE